jgi:tripartite-type tricarboxylate transporter receptor subunit TctC
MVTIRWTFALFIMALAVPCRADPVEDFYKGRTLTILAGFNTGGAYDQYARTVAKHIRKHIPGSPTIIVKNMQGAGSVIAANYLYNRSPKDGSEIGLIAGTAALEPLFGVVPTQFDGQKFTWLGSANKEVGGCFAWHTSSIRTAQNLFDQGMITGTAGTSSMMVPTMLNNVVGTRLKLVRGYKGTSELMLAIERGEVEGMCGMVWAALQTEHPDWVQQGFVRTVMQIGLTKSTDMPDAPLVMDFAKDEAAQQVLRLLIGWTIMGRPFLAPPGIPEDRKAALRKAFDATMKDPEFLADAERSRLEVSPIGPEEIEAYLRDVYAAPKPLIERANEILAPSR